MIKILTILCLFWVTSGYSITCEQYFSKNSNSIVPDQELAETYGRMRFYLYDFFTKSDIPTSPQSHPIIIAMTASSQAVKNQNISLRSLETIGKTLSDILLQAGLSSDNTQRDRVYLRVNETLDIDATEGWFLKEGLWVQTFVKALRHPQMTDRASITFFSGFEVHIERALENNLMSLETARYLASEVINCYMRFNRLTSTPGNEQSVLYMVSTFRKHNLMTISDAHMLLVNHIETLKNNPSESPFIFLMMLNTLGRNAYEYFDAGMIQDLILLTERIQNYSEEHKNRMRQNITSLIKNPN